MGSLRVITETTIELWHAERKARSAHEVMLGSVVPISSPSCRSEGVKVHRKCSKKLLLDNMSPSIARKVRSNKSPYHSPTLLSGLSTMLWNRHIDIRQPVPIKESWSDIACHNSSGILLRLDQMWPFASISCASCGKKCWKSTERSQSDCP